MLVVEGRTAANLSETAAQVAKKQMNLNDVRVKTVAVDVTDESGVKQIVDALDGEWNVLIHAAGHINVPAPVAQTDIDDYWKAYEVGSPSFLLFFVSDPCILHFKRITKPNINILSIMVH